VIEVKVPLRVRRIHHEAAGGDHVGVRDHARQLIDQSVVVRAIPIIRQLAGKERGRAKPQVCSQASTSSPG